MRSREGEHLRADLSGRRAALGGLLDNVVAAAESGRAPTWRPGSWSVHGTWPRCSRSTRRRSRRIVRVAQRSDIAEEVTRFRGHLEHWEALTGGPEPCGRKLDFLLEEMNREVNTIEVEGRRAPDLGAHHPGQGRARADAGNRSRMSSRTRGLLFIVSAPSGAGKTTLVEHLVRSSRTFACRARTSRPARAGERDGVDYNFVDRAEFHRMVAANAFLEWADVFGNCYGTAAADTERMLASGQDVVLVIDVEGARQVKSHGVDHTSIFILPPSFDVLERRLRGRSKDTEDQMQRRLATARAEVSSYRQCDYVVVNDQLEPTVVRLQEDHRGRAIGACTACRRSPRKSSRVFVPDPG
ncbi:MAG: guanylate kinase [Vicinamibacterales bacterium]